MHDAKQTAIIQAQPSALAVPAPLTFTPEQRKMIRDTYASGANDSEFAMLMEIARARNLNPLLRQIWFVKRWDSQKRCEVWAPQVSIDGLRSIAQRTGLYDGQDEPEFSEEGKQLVCRVRVYRKDWGRPSVGVAHFAEYAGTTKEGKLTKMWAEKPHIMIAKCAEALALRKAFPEDTAGLYVQEEMPQDEQPTPKERVAAVLKRAEQVAKAAEAPALPAKHVTIIDVPADPAPEAPSDEALLSLEAAIAEAQTLEDLRKLPARIKALPPEPMKALKAAYEDRYRELNGGQQ